MPVEPSQVGLGVENVSDTHILIKEGREGITEITSYKTKEDALDGLNTIRKKLRKTHIKFDECRKEVQNCIDAIVDKRYYLYTVQTLEDAVKPTGKMIWSVNQSVYLSSEMTKHFEWKVLYATKDEAEKLFKERLGLYKMQADEDPRIEIVMTKSGLGALIYKDKKPLIDLYCESQVAGSIGDIGTVILKHF